MKLVERTIGGHLDWIARQYPQAEAVVCGETRLTYRELNEQADCLARGMLAMGISKGTHIALEGRNRAGTLLCLYAALRIGAVSVLSSAQTPAEILLQRMRDTHTHWLLAENETLCQAVSQAGMDALCISPEGLARLKQAGQGVSDAQLAAAAALVRPEDTDVILFTSGTTSKAKAVLTTHRSRLNNALSTAQCNGVTQADRFCAALPINHCFSLVANVFASMSMGACLCFTQDHHSQSILDTIQAERCTVLHGVPTLFFSAARRQQSEPRDISSLRMGMIGGAGYTPEQFLWAARALDFALLPSLGMTEATAGVTVGYFEDSDLVKSTTVGHLFPGLEARFCDPATRRVLPQGQVGELCIRGYSVMQGYYGIPDSDVIDADGFLHTGDLGSMDASGNITLAGRCKDIIIRGGENIAPAEVEAVIRQVGGVQDVKVVGVPDDHFGEELCACVIAGEPVSSEKLREHTAGVLPPCKVPRYVLFVDSFPLNEMGKINKKALVALAVDRLPKEQ